MNSFLRATFLIANLAVAATISSVATPVRGAVVTSGSLTFDLDGAAFANNPDNVFLNGAGIAPTAGQTWLEFARHSQASPAGRPQANPPLVSFNDIRAGWSRPSSTGLVYDFNPNTSLQTFNFDPLTILASGGTGNIQFLGGDSFWFANQAAIATGSIWIQYGNLALNYSAARNNGTNSGWLFTNYVADPAGTVDVFDVRNLSLTLGVNSLTMTGDLFVHEDFRDFTGVSVGIDVGSFSFNGVTAVPEPSSFAFFGIAGVAGVFLRRGRATNIASAID